MPCRHATDGDGGDVDPENFAKTALVLGGSRAIRTAIDREGTPELPAGRDPPETGSQHDWAGSECPVEHGSGGTTARTPRGGNGRGDGESGSGGCPVDHGGHGSDPGSEAHDGHGSDPGSEDAGESEDPNESEDHDESGPAATGGERDERTPPSPRFHLLLSLTCEGRPDASDRNAVETALSDLERALGWGPSGILTAIGYAPSYFARFEDPLPSPVRSDHAFARDPVAADGGRTPGGDTLLHLASDDARVLLAAEEALFGGDPVLDVELGATLRGAFERPRDPPERRVAVAAGDWVAPEGDGGIDAGRFEGGAIQRIEPAGAEQPAGCPAHEGQEGRSADLARLDPATSETLSVAFTAPNPETGSGSGSGESYLIPPRSERSLPRPGAR